MSATANTDGRISNMRSTEAQFKSRRLAGLDGDASTHAALLRAFSMFGRTAAAGDHEEPAMPRCKSSSYSGQRVSKGVKRRLLIERNGTMLNRKPSKTIADITFEALWRRLYQSWTAFHAQEELSRLSQRDWYDNEIFWRDDIPYIVQYGYHWSIVRHDEIEQLLALEDRDLTAMGLHRGDLEAYRDGRIKFLDRRSAAQPTAADQDNARHGN